MQISSWIIISKILRFSSFTGRMSFPSLNQRCQSTEDDIIWPVYTKLRPMSCRNLPYTSADEFPETSEMRNVTLVPLEDSIPGPMKMVRNRRKRPSPINSRLATNIRVRWWLQLRIDFDSTVVRLKFDCNSTALRPFDELRYAWADALRPK